MSASTSTNAALSIIIAPLLAVRTSLLKHRAQGPGLPAADDGTGGRPHVALAFKAAIDDPQRFSRSRTVGAHFGLAPRQHSSGEVDYSGRISKMGDQHVRSMLYVAALAILRGEQGLWCRLKVWVLGLAKTRGIRKVRVALARRLAVTLHKMWAFASRSAGGRRRLPPDDRRSGR